MAKLDDIDLSGSIEQRKIEKRKFVLGMMLAMDDKFPIDKIVDIKAEPDGSFTVLLDAEEPACPS